MTNWRAVLIGFGVEVGLGLVAILLPGIGHAAAGLIGGFVAGYIAGGSLGSGAWHGLLAGALGGIVIAVFLAATVTLVGSIGAGPLGPVLGGATLLIALGVALLLALDSALGGLVGAALASD
ncbi:DUF5518 domain-containing protein [Halanaeroarchaeum sulfurireducens]|uniref:DUF5518 domain-containing protein n=1 Tax=Halanaeroarchaeum sulfurireducens TaxID=1604004 RepID=UPI000678B39E|nr:DUF5518 domain-containing protein [Halanaeroarchaeum sulfurireducens]